ncbi:pilus assembly PilX N-terminal domain-containing protein [Patescibacteria group bacterium]|nr:pilus assembly PilX N-terminal domain-containing protein [Patescibacteria group bacterium]
MNIENTRKNNKGQAMMIVIMVLSGVMISAIAVSGVLTARQTRQSADAGSSSKAIFAADAGLEWIHYKVYEGNFEKLDACDLDCPDENDDDCDQFPEFDEITNGIEVKLETTCELDDSGDYNNYEISSTGKTYIGDTQRSSYTFSEKFYLPKIEN